MKPFRSFTGFIVAAVIAGAAIAQSPGDGPKFDIADVHVSAKKPNPYVRITPTHNGRYEIHTATMVDLIHIAYGFDSDKVLGGPSWLEMGRYDITAKVPADTSPEVLNDMLKSLLADRFKLVVHKDTKPLATFALTVGRKPLIKEADGTGDTGCRPHEDSSSPTPGDGVTRLMMMGEDGKTTTLTIGPGQIVQYSCRNMTMDAFVGAMSRMMGASVGPNPVLDQTGLKGGWNFDLKYSLNLIGLALGGATGDRISFPEAVDKQLGLKLEEHPVPTPVIVVDSVEDKPTPNPAGVSEALPPIAVPSEFEVADIKPLDPGATMGGRFGMQPGGRFVSNGLPLSFLIQRAFDVQSAEQIVGLPPMDAARYSITAKAAVPAGADLDTEATSVLLLALLKDRFGLKYHSEERPIPAYSLVALKPKLKKADLASRTHCNRSNPPAGSAPGSTMMTCQNITMAQFAEQLRGSGQGLTIQPLDATELEGGWDFTLIWSPRAGMNLGPMRAAEGASPAPDAPAASDPNGGITIFEAVEKQLGLKLEMKKRPVPVYVIDHFDQKPTDN
jgi:uncharacterized protein (TIGR03435 family)